MFVLPANGSPTPTPVRKKAWSCTATRPRPAGTVPSSTAALRATNDGSSDGSMSTFSRWCSAGSMSTRRRCGSDGRRSSIPSARSRPGMGATHFLMKTLPKAATEMALHVLAYNLTRVINIMGVQPLIAAIRA